MTGHCLQTEHAQTWGRKVVQSADGARVTVRRAVRYVSFFIAVRKEEDWRVFVPLQSIALRCLLFSFAREREAPDSICCYLATPGRHACAGTLVYL